MKKKWLFVLVAVAVIALMSCSAFAETPYVSEITRDGIPKQSFIFATWNAWDLGKTKLKENPETIDFMADVLRECDLFALQEISTSDFGAGAVARLWYALKRKGSKWLYVISDPTHGPGTERFAFFWRPDKVQAIPERAFLSQKLRDVFDREPAKVNFRINGTIVTVVNMHLQPDNIRNGKDPRPELAALVMDPDYAQGRAIFAGDFNLSLKELSATFEKTLNAKCNIDGKTSLKGKVDKKGRYLHKAYDNIATRGLRVHDAGIVDFVPKVGNLKNARKISDHLPAFIVFSVE